MGVKGEKLRQSSNTSLAVGRLLQIARKRENEHYLQEVLHLASFSYISDSSQLEFMETDPPSRVASLI